MFRCASHLSSLFYEPALANFNLELHAYTVYSILDPQTSTQLMPVMEVVSFWFRHRT